MSLGLKWTIHTPQVRFGIGWQNFGVSGIAHVPAYIFASLYRLNEKYSCKAHIANFRLWLRLWGSPQSTFPDCMWKISALSLFISSSKSHNGSWHIIAAGCQARTVIITMMFALWNCTVNDEYHIHILKKNKSKCIVSQISLVCANKFTLYKLLKLYHWEIMTVCSLDRFVLHYKPDSFLGSAHESNKQCPFVFKDWLAALC